MPAMADPAVTFCAHQRMQHSFQQPPLGCIGEHDLTQPAPVQTAIISYRLREMASDDRGYRMILAKQSVNSGIRIKMRNP